MAIWANLHSPKLQHYWILKIRLFRIISRTLLDRGFTPLQRCSQCILQPQPTRPQNTPWLSFIFLTAEMQSVHSVAPADKAIGNPLVESYLSAKMKSVNSVAPAD